MQDINKKPCNQWDFGTIKKLKNNHKRYNYKTEKPYKVKDLELNQHSIIDLNKRGL